MEIGNTVYKFKKHKTPFFLGEDESILSCIEAVEAIPCPCEI